MLFFFIGRMDAWMDGRAIGQKGSNGDNFSKRQRTLEEIRVLDRVEENVRNREKKKIVS